MPFVKSNWACEPELHENGAFEFGRAYTVKDLSLHRAEQTRPCFLHGKCKLNVLVYADGCLVVVRRGGVDAVGLA